MERIARGWKAAAAGGAVLTVLAQTKPDDAISNIAAWAKLVGIDQLPRFLVQPHADFVATVFGIFVVVISVFMWRREVRHIHHKEITAQSKGAASMEMDVHRAPQMPTLPSPDHLQEALAKRQDEWFAERMFPRPGASPSPSDTWFRRGIEDHIENQSLDRKAKWEAERQPKRDTPLKQALTYAVLGDWDEHNIIDLAKHSQGIADANIRFQQLALDGSLHAWGKRGSLGSSALYELIPSDHWRDYEVMDHYILMGEPSTSERNPWRKTEGGDYYLDVQVSRAEFEREWPHSRGLDVATVISPMARKINPKKERQRDLITQGRDIAFGYTHEAPEEGFRAYLEGQRAYADIRPHLSPEYLVKLTAPRTVYVKAQGAKYEPLVDSFLREIDRLEREWNLA